MGQRPSFSHLTGYPEAVASAQDFAPYGCTDGPTLSLDASSDDPLWVEVDALRLKQVMVNLVKNAIKFVSRASCASARGVRAPARSSSGARTRVLASPTARSTPYSISTSSSTFTRIIATRLSPHTRGTRDTTAAHHVRAGCGRRRPRAAATKLTLCACHTPDGDGSRNRWPRLLRSKAHSATLTLKAWRTSASAISGLSMPRPRSIEKEQDRLAFHQ